MKLREIIFSDAKRKIFIVSFLNYIQEKNCWEGWEMQKQSRLQNFDGVSPVARKWESSAACRHRSTYLLLGYVDARTHPLSGYVQVIVQGWTPSKNCDRGWVSPSPAFLCLPTFFSWMWLRKLTIRILLSACIKKKYPLTPSVAYSIVKNTI